MKIYFKTVGCRVNQIETQSLAEKFSGLGHESVASYADADLIIINSCSVTEYADRDTLNFIKKTVMDNPAARLVVTGCMATLSPEKITALAPGAVLFPNKDKAKIPASLTGGPVAEDFFSVGKFSGRTRAFVKVQDGCDLKCSYCLVPAARADIASKPVSAAEAEIRKLVAGGFKEIVLCGTRLGMYKCPDTGLDLAGLMERLFSMPGDFRLRFSSLEPVEIEEPIAKLLAGAGDRFCDYFHLPLQAGSDDVLRAMRRPYNTAGYMKKLDTLRKYFREPGIYADVIAGFPSETDEQFSTTLSFVEKCGFAGLHVFRFSRRPGTEAFTMKALSSGVVKDRSSRLHELDKRLRASYAASMFGRTLKTLVLRNKGGISAGLASNFLNVDMRAGLKPGTFVQATITGALNGTCSADNIRLTP